jgi:predicted phosphodiesterase
MNGEDMTRKGPLYIALIAALIAGRCSYSIEDGGYDLSRFGDDPTLTEAPPGLQGLVPTNAEAAWDIQAAWRPGGPLRFVVIGDTVSDHNRTFKAFLPEIGALDPPPSFIVHLGDRVVSPVAEFYGAYLKAIADPPCPIIHVEGNHDVREQGERISKAFFGDKDLFVDLGDRRFVFMGNARARRRHGFTREQLAWLDRVLESPVPSRKFVFAHVPPMAPFRKFSPGLAVLFTPRIENEAEFLDILARRRVVMAAFGHRHIHATTVHNGVLMVITGGGGQRNFVEPNVKKPLFTKKNHYTVVDVPEAGPFEALDGVLACVGRGHETLFRSWFVQPEMVADGGDGPVMLLPYPAPDLASLPAALPARPRLGGSVPAP